MNDLLPLLINVGGREVAVDPREVFPQLGAPAADRAVLEQCLDVLLRMCPAYCMDAQAEPCSEAEHDAAMAAALTVFHGADRDAWPPVARALLEGFTA